MNQQLPQITLLGARHPQPGIILNLVSADTKRGFVSSMKKSRSEVRSHP
jgi:hypothetical protein